MPRRGRPYICFLIVVLIFTLALGTGLAASEKPGTSSAAIGNSSLSPDKLPDMLAAATATLTKKVADLRQRQQVMAKTLRTDLTPSDDLRGRLAALKASMAVRELDLAGAKEALRNVRLEKEKTAALLKELNERQEALAGEINNQGESLSIVKEQVAKLGATNHAVNRSRKLSTVYQNYLRLAKEYDATAKGYQEFLGKSLKTLQGQEELLHAATTALEDDYLEKAFAQELQRRQSLRHRALQIGQSLVTLGALPGKAQAWLWEVFQSGALAAFIDENLANFLGLGLFLLFLGWGVHRLQKLVLPGLAKWQEQVSGVNLKGFLAFCHIFLERLFSVSFVGWLYLAFWHLEVITSKVGWLAWSLAATLVALNLILKLIQRSLAGPEAGGILPLSGATAQYYRRRLQLLATYFFLLRFFVLANAPELGLSDEIAGNLQTIFQAVLLGGVLWLVGNRQLEPVLAALPLPTSLKSRNFLRSLRSAAFLVFVLLVISGLLGFKFFFEYLAQGAAFTLIVLALAWILGQTAYAILRLTIHPELGVLAKKCPRHQQLFLKSYQIIIHAVKLALAGVALLVTLKVWGISPERLAGVFQWLHWGPSLGPVHLTPFNLGLVALIIYGGFGASRLLRRFLEQKFYPRRGWDPGIQYTISMTTHYVILVIATLLAMNTLGITFTTLALMAGGLGVGIGFGLQNIISNFLSGLILLYERPIKVGDMLIIDGQWGTVKEIRVRSTIFQTFDRYFLIIPNSDLISGKILNWTYDGWGINRLSLKVGVSYGSDPQKTTEIIEEVCRANPKVVAEPPPQIFFQAYGDSSLDFNIWVHLATPNDRIPATHELNSAIFQAFQANGIEIPFPQRDLHVRTWPPRDVSARSGIADHPPQKREPGAPGRPAWDS